MPRQYSMTLTYPVTVLLNVQAESETEAYNTAIENVSVEPELHNIKVCTSSEKVTLVSTYINDVDSETSSVEQSE